MFFAAGAKWRDIAIVVGTGAIGLILIVSMRPYLLDRWTTFLNPGDDPRGNSYQIQQSLLAVGAGQAFGRGFGQSVQKFGKLPEPMSDSIFSVFAEEFGFIGSIALIVAFATFALRGLWVAARSPDLYGGLIAVGIVTMIITQSFMNIAAMLGLVPLTGLPLIFVSHGGTALLIALGTTGILLSVSRYIKT
jgi:cell division protein FtsW